MVGQSALAKRGMLREQNDAGHVFEDFSCSRYQCEPARIKQQTCTISVRVAENLALTSCTYRTDVVVSCYQSRKSKALVL